MKQHIYWPNLPFNKTVIGLFICSRDRSLKAYKVMLNIVDKMTCLIPGGAIGDCVTDSFVFSSPGNKGSPTICGINTGQHSKLQKL